MNLHASNPYDRTGYRPLPETFDMEFVHHIQNTYLDHWVDIKIGQKWDEIELKVHADFDHRFGAEKVTRHFELVKTSTIESDERYLKSLAEFDKKHGLD